MTWYFAINWSNVSFHALLHAVSYSGTEMDRKMAQMQAGSRFSADSLCLGVDKILWDAFSQLFAVHRIPWIFIYCLLMSIVVLCSVFSELHGSFKHFVVCLASIWDLDPRCSQGVQHPGVGGLVLPLFSMIRMIWELYSWALSRSYPTFPWVFM